MFLHHARSRPQIVPTQIAGLEVLARILRGRAMARDLGNIEENLVQTLARNAKSFECRLSPLLLAD